MGGDDEAVRAPVVVVVASGEVEHRGGEVVCEGARSAAERKPISVSIASVGNALPVDQARRARAPTSRTIRPAKATR